MAGGPQWVLNCDRWASAAADGWSVSVNDLIRCHGICGKYVLIMIVENKLQQNMRLWSSMIFSYLLK